MKLQRPAYASEWMSACAYRDGLECVDGEDGGPHGLHQRDEDPAPERVEREALPADARDVQLRVLRVTRKAGTQNRKRKMRQQAAPRFSIGHTPLQGARRRGTSIGDLVSLHLSNVRVCCWKAYHIHVP